MHKKQLYHTASEKVSEREREREKPSKSIKRIRFFEKKYTEPKKPCIYRGRQSIKCYTYRRIPAVSAYRTKLLASN
jgi:hypothetical protein